MTSIRVPFTSIMGALAESALISVFMSVTVSDVVMSDGSRLESAGVIPDEGLLPTGRAFNDRMDPVLSYVAVKMGGNLNPIRVMGNMEVLYREQLPWNAIAGIHVI